MPGRKPLIPKSLTNGSTANLPTGTSGLCKMLNFRMMQKKTEPDSRKFRGKSKDGGRDQHYMIHNVLRYEDYFIMPDEILKKYFENIPFLNGGLFECLDREITVNGQDKDIRIDGFSQHSN